MSWYTLLSYFYLKRKVSTSIPVQKGIRQSEYVNSPFVLGLFCPVVYLPYSMDAQDAVHVIAHEQAHIRRKDHWWKPLGFLLLTIHWFNPLMWVAYVLLCRDIELACDEKVIRELGNEQRADYSQALVSCSVNRLHVAACPLAFGEVGVKERVKSIMNYRKPAFWIIVIALVVCAVVAVCFLTDPNPSREFAMNGKNVSGLDPEEILERILDIEDLGDSTIHMNSLNFSLHVDSNFNWMDAQSVQYFFSDARKTYSGQLRIFPEEGTYFLTEPNELQEQERFFLLQHYLEAVKYLPQDAIRQMAPADQYIIQHIDGGSPSDYTRVITYSREGVQETDGWFIHLQIQPMHAQGTGYYGNGEEVIELFYGGSSGKSSASAKKWFDYTANPEQMDWDDALKCTMEEYPGVTFQYTPSEIIAITGQGERAHAVETVLISGLPVWSAYFCDLTGDGLPEICAETSFGSGMIDDRVVIFDYADGVSYLFEDRGSHDYYLRMGNTDGCLYIDKRVYNSSEVVESGRLLFNNGNFQIEDGSATAKGSSEPYAVLKATILEINDSYFIVEPVEGSWELGTSDRIEVPAGALLFVAEPRVGDILRIEYDGQLMETYPARIGKMYKSSVLERGASETLIPTDTTLQGLQAGALLVPMEGGIYRYDLAEHDPEGVTVDELLDAFTEVDLYTEHHWEVYSLKEYPDRSAVLLICAEGSWLCTYSPPGRCADTALDDAIAAGYVVMEDGGATHGQEAWREFYELTRQGKVASITVADYHTLDPARCDYAYCETFRQDYPSLTVYRLRFDWTRYTLTFREGDTFLTRTYEYLLKYDTAGSAVAPQGSWRYVLTHDDTVTWEQLIHGIASSQLGAYIDHYAIYTERKP